VSFFAALRDIKHLSAANYVPVILLSAKAGLCKSEDKPERARPTLAAAGISVYRLTA
jgi:hypothetical protein